MIFRRGVLTVLVSAFLLGCAATPLPTDRPTNEPTHLPTGSPTDEPSSPPNPPTTDAPQPSATTVPTGEPTAVAVATREPRATFDASRLTGRIVFSHEGDIWVMNADGTAREQLTDHPAEDFDPAWSPDGTQIAFRSHRDGSPEVYLIDADGTDERNLTDSPLSDYSPAWSPDGTRIAFASNRDADSGGNDIYLSDVASGTTERLTIGGDIDEYPTWSPDGSRIAYACSDGLLQGGTADFELCVMDADGSNMVQVTDADGLSDYPVWSPDGELIAFQSTRGGWPTMPGYTPPGYEEGEFGEYDVYVVAPDGGGVRNVTENGYESDQFPAWSPDGAHIVVSRYGCLVAVALDGSAEAQLSDPQNCADVFADWTSAGSR